MARDGHHLVEDATAVVTARFRISVDENRRDLIARRHADLPHAPLRSSHRQGSMSAEATGDYFGNISGDAMRVLIQIVALQHPSRPRWLRCWPRLPRPRGDAPRHRAHRASLGSAPPPTRGCTSLCRRCWGVPKGSPAHAGMHLRQDPNHCRESRLPRPRGDAPRELPVGYDIGLAPPPTRGCTFFSGSGGDVGSGSPAHAGMHPRQPEGGEARRSLACWPPSE